MWDVRQRCISEDGVRGNRDRQDVLADGDGVATSRAQGRYTGIGSGRRPGHQPKPSRTDGHRAGGHHSTDRPGVDCENSTRQCFDERF
jgi:hypothetical protein